MAYLSNSTATMLDEQQQPYQSTWEEYECEENVYQRGGTVMMMGAPTTTNSGDETLMIPPNARRVSQEEFLAPPSAMTKTTTSSSSSCLGKHKYDSTLISTTQQDAPSAHASKTPRTNFGTVPSAAVTATSTSSSSTTKSTMTDFAYDPHDPSYIPVAPLLRHSSSIGMGLPLLSPFLNATTSLGSLLGGLPLPPAPLLRAQSSSFSFAGSEARFAITAGVGGGANDVSEEDTAAAVSALLDLTPAVTSRHINHHHIHGRTPLTELNRATSSDTSHDHQKASSNSNNSTSSTTTTTSNMPSLLPPAAAHGSTNDHQQTDNASTLVASIHHAAETASRLLVNVPISDKACKCKNTSCLKLYCACFSLGTLCDPKNCICKDCKNTDSFNGPNGDRTKAVGGILQRRFDAFDKTRPKKKTGAGCACKKTKCLKKYCDCFNNEVVCGDACTCTDCANTTLAEMTAQEWKNSTSSSSSPAASPQPV